jgi:hypothetical protein
MFGSRRHSTALTEPPVAGSDPSAVEVLRVWASPSKGQQLTINPLWKDPAAWGLVVVDVARHAARAYAQNGLSENAALARIRQAMDAEWASPTDAPKSV